MSNNAEAILLQTIDDLGLGVKSVEARESVAFAVLESGKVLLAWESGTIELTSTEAMALGFAAAEEVLGISGESKQHLSVMEERCKWLAARIEAKKKVGWETQWDEREHKALAYWINRLKPRQKG